MKRFVSLIVALVCCLAETAHAALFRFMVRTGAVLCSVQLPNGSIVAIAASYGPVTDIDALSNANPAVAQISASHGVANADILEITSGWSRLTNKIVRATGVSGNNVSLEGFNSTDTSLFPALSGVGTLREILTWTQLAQILESGTDGGEQQFLTYQFLEDDAQKRIPTVKNPSGMTFSIGDDPTLAGYILAAEANTDRQPRAIRITLPSGAKIFYNAYITLNEIPSLTVNELMAVEATLSLLSLPTRYTS